MTGEGILRALEAATRALSAAGTRHALIGGVALPAWGRIRATVDVADVEALIAINRSALDREYLESRARERGLSAALSAVWT